MRTRALKRALTVVRVPAVAALLVSTGVSINQVLNDKVWDWRWLAFAFAVAVVAESLNRLLTYLEARESASTVTTATAADRLAELVGQQWRVEAEISGVDDFASMPVTWRLTNRPRVMDHPANLAAPVISTARSDDVAALVDDFRRLNRRRLVIVGDAGTGKTTLAVQVLRRLLATREGHPSEPVPVLLPVAGWDPDVHPRLADWLAYRIGEDYPALRSSLFGTDAPRALAEQGRILAVLDGLDEVGPDVRPKVIRALGRSLGDQGIVLTSRTRELADGIGKARRVVKSALVLEAQPIGSDAAADYLERCAPPDPHPTWQRIVTGLRTGDLATRPVAGVARTPFGLWLIRAVHLDADTDPTPLLDAPSAATLRDRLLDDLVPALIAARPPVRGNRSPYLPRRRHRPERAEPVLGALAAYLTTVVRQGDRPGSQDLMWWKLAQYATPVRFYQWFTRLTMASLYASMCYAITAFVDPGVALVTAAIGAVLGLLGVGGPGLGNPTGGPGENATRADNDRPRHVTFSPGRREVSIGWYFVIGASRSLLVGGVLAWSAREEDVGWVVLALGSLLLFGLTLGLLNWVEVPIANEDAATPMTTWCNDRRVVLVRMVIGGLMFTIVVLVLLAPRYGITDALFPAGLAGVAGGLTYSFAMRYRAWSAYFLTVVRLRWRLGTPVRLMALLDDMHRIGVLRAVGPVYQFRHADVQAHLARKYADLIPGERPSGKDSTQSDTAWLRSTAPGA